MIASSDSSVWDSGTEPLILKRKVRETPDTVSFFFETPTRARFEFKPGQFVTLKVEIDGQLYGRSYSMTSLPDENVMQLTVKRVTGGVVSNWLIDHLEPEEALWTYGIAGDFNAVDHKSKNKVLLLSSGCGIAPIMSIAQHFIHAPNTNVDDIMFVYRAVNVESVIFLEKMLEMQKLYPQFKACVLLKDGDEKGRLPEGLPHMTGTLTQEHLERVCPDYQERSVFLCGSTSYMRATKRLLESLAFDMKNFHQESFTPNVLTGKPQPVCVENEVFTVKVPKFGFENEEVEKDASLLDVLVDGDLPIVAACYSGLCGSCMCKVTSGKVESSSTGPLNQRQIEEGYVLACCSTVIEDVEVDL